MIIGAPLAAPLAAETLELRLARLVPGEPADRAEPARPPLTAADVKRYREIFALQAKDRWREADRLVAKLANRLLLGHVLAHRYLKKGYAPTYAELRSWLEKYSDHPQAMAIHVLAAKSRPKDAPPPPDPREGGLDESGRKLGGSAAYGFSTKRERSREAELLVRAWRQRIERLVEQTDFDAAKQALGERAVRRHLDSLELDLARWVVARGLLDRHRTAEALALAHDAARRSGHVEPRIHWTAGLAAWRRNEHATAAEHFAALAGAAGLTGEDLAMAAVWAARAHLAAGKPRHVTRFLRIGAEASSEFYGRIAQALLGDAGRLDWQDTSLRSDTLEFVVRFPASRRVLALAQIGREDLAEDEIVKLSRRAQPGLAAALEALSEALELPAAQVAAARRISETDGRRHLASLYPVPRWQPRKGFKLDRALVYAIIRAESDFNPRARSHQGAIGVMQILPETAALVRRLGKGVYGGPASLHDPALNMEIGQAWIAWLMDRKAIGDNLIHVVLGYNAGPKRVAAWARDLPDMRDDPLLFIESVPNKESRNYVKRVLANLWAYRARFGQDDPSLTELAENRWPRVHRLDRGAKQYAGKN
jgi:soluble lytic murein transglycosylase-like protein